jgi:hypothetical protein
MDSQECVFGWEFKKSIEPAEPHNEHAGITSVGNLKSNDQPVGERMLTIDLPSPVEVHRTLGTNSSRKEDVVGTVSGVIVAAGE